MGYIPRYRASDYINDRLINTQGVVWNRKAGEKIVENVHANLRCREDCPTRSTGRIPSRSTILNRSVGYNRKYVLLVKTRARRNLKATRQHDSDTRIGSRELTILGHAAALTPSKCRVIFLDPCSRNFRRKKKLETSSEVITKIKATISLN